MSQEIDSWITGPVCNPLNSPFKIITHWMEGCFHFLWPLSIKSKCWNRNVTPKTQSNDNLTGWWRDCVPVFVCAIQIQDVSQIFSPTPFLFVRVYLSLLVSPAFIEANRLNACPTVPDHSPLNRISLRQPEDLKWSGLQASKRKREREAHR